MEKRQLLPSHRLVAQIVFMLIVMLLPAACSLLQGGSVPTPVVMPATPLAPVVISDVTVSPPTAEAIAPMPTYNPSLPAWTVMVYRSGDNDMIGQALAMLNELEAAEPDEQVQIVAQIDWSPAAPDGNAEAVRYVIRPDDDRTQIGSEAAERLGEINSGDPSALAQFITWAVANYPANRYALFLGDYGGGWRGCCLDENAGAPGQVDHLDLADLRLGLEQARVQTGLARLDVIAFGASLMGQLDVLQAVQPFAAYAVASPALVPGEGWPFDEFLNNLNADPQIDGGRFAGQLVSEYVNFYRQLRGEEAIAMAAVDLSRLPAVAAAVDTLAYTLTTDPLLSFGAAGDARRGSQTYALAAATDADQIAAVDLYHLASILAQRSPNSELQIAARAVTLALDEAIIAADYGERYPNGRGVAVYWPSAEQYFDPVYTQVSSLAGWSNFLVSFVSDPPGKTPPVVQMIGGPRDTAGTSRPAYLAAEFSGRQLDRVATVTVEDTAEGRKLLLRRDTLIPPARFLPDGAPYRLWEDGHHESLVVWDTLGQILRDSNGTVENVLLWAAEPAPQGPALVAQGRYGRAGRDTALDANLVFLPAAATPGRIWGVATSGDGSRLLGEIAPAPGDAFQTFRFYLEDDGRVTAEEGGTLIFDTAPTLYREAQPLADGPYQVGLTAGALGGIRASDSLTLRADNAQEIAGYRAYVDPQAEVQFLYPAGWSTPIGQDTAVYTANISNTARLQVRYYPDWSGDAEALQTEVLSTFGGVSVLNQDSIGIGEGGSVAAVRTAYGYESSEQGARTGVLLTFVHDGWGYSLDFDGPRTTESDTLAAVDVIARNWQFLPFRLGFGPERWTSREIAGFEVAYPATYAYQEHNGWHRLAENPQTFVAVRTQPLARMPGEALAALQELASTGVSDFVAETPTALWLGGHPWDRVDFSYTDSAGQPVRGFVMVRNENGQEIAAWAEAPAAQYAALENSVFLSAAAGLRPSGNGAD